MSDQYSGSSKKSNAYEEFLKWKNSMQGQNIINQANTTIIKSDVIDKKTQEELNPEEERQIIEKTRSGPKGVGKGTAVRNDGQHGRKDCPVGAEDDNLDEDGNVKKKKKHNKNKFNNIGTHLERARLGQDDDKYGRPINRNQNARGGYQYQQSYEQQQQQQNFDHEQREAQMQQQFRQQQDARHGINEGPGAADQEGYQDPDDVTQASSSSKGPKSRQDVFLASMKMHQNKNAADSSTDKIILRDQKAKLITFEMISINRFAVTQNFFMPEEIVQILKKYGGAFDFTSREWIVGLNKYKEVATEISGFCRVKLIDLDPITQMAFDLLEYSVPFTDETKKNIVNYDYRHDIMYRPMLSLLPPSLYHSLYNFQKVGVQYGIDHFGRIILGDEMGVGKTIQAISIAYLFQRDWPILIITPSSLKYSWRDELLTWVEHLRSDQIQVFVKSTEEFEQSACIYIMSYVLATKLSAFIDRKKFGFCIADEAHYLKSRDSQRSKYLVPVLMKIKRVLLLSGTPILARPNEIYNLLRIQRPDIFYSFKEFGLRYCSPRESYFGVDWTGSSNMRELHLMLEKGLMIRRLKSEVLTELPAKRRQRIIVPCDQHCIKKISNMLKKVKNWEDNYADKGAAAGQGPGEGSRKKDENGNLIDSVQTDFDKIADSTDLLNDADLEAMDDKYSHLLSAYQMTGSAKVKGTVEFLENLVESKVKFIVFCHHYEVMDQIEDSIVKKKIAYIRIDGQIEATKRYDAVRKFQTDPEILVGILSLTASSQGITLTAATTVVFAEMNWTPGIMVQAEDRCHRIGQANSVNVYYLFGENTVDAMIYPRLKLKSEVFANVLDGKKTEFTIENEDDMEKLGNEGVDQNSEMQKMYQKEAKVIEKALNSEDKNKFQQTTVKDFFFMSGIGKKTSKIAAQQDDTENQNNKEGDEDTENNGGKVDQNMEVNITDDKDNIMINDGEQNFQHQYNFEQFDPDDMEFARPPVPSLASVNHEVEKPTDILDVEAEIWGEGADSKWKAYQQLRSERKRYYAEQKELKKNKRHMKYRGNGNRDFKNNKGENEDFDIDWKKDQNVMTQSQDHDYVKDEKNYGMKSDRKGEEDEYKQERQRMKKAKGEYRDLDEASQSQDSNNEEGKRPKNQKQRPQEEEAPPDIKDEDNSQANEEEAKIDFNKYNRYENQGQGYQPYRGGNGNFRGAYQNSNSNRFDKYDFENRQFDTPYAGSKHQRWQTDRYKEKISKYYDKKKTAAYDEYLVFKRSLAKTEEEFLRRLPKSDPSLMKFRIRELEKQYQSGGTDKTVKELKKRHDIIEEVFGIRPVKHFTHEPQRHLNFIEYEIVYLEGEKFVQDWETPTLDPSKCKIKGNDRNMLEDCKGPHNTCVASDEEGFDAEAENENCHIKFEEQQEKNFKVKQEFQMKKEEREKKEKEEQESLALMHASEVRKRKRRAQGLPEYDSQEEILKRKKAQQEDEEDKKAMNELMESENIDDILDPDRQSSQRQKDELSHIEQNKDEVSSNKIDKSNPNPTELSNKDQNMQVAKDLKLQPVVVQPNASQYTQVCQAKIDEIKQATISNHKKPVTDKFENEYLMPAFDLDNMVLQAIQEEEIKKFEEKDKYYNDYEEEQSQKKHNFVGQKTNQWGDPIKDGEEIPYQKKIETARELAKKSANSIDPFTFFEQTKKKEEQELQQEIQKNQSQPDQNDESDDDKDDKVYTQDPYSSQFEEKPKIEKPSKIMAKEISQITPEIQLQPDQEEQMQDESELGGIIDDKNDNTPVVTLPKEDINGSSLPQTKAKPKINFSFSKQSKKKEKKNQELSIFSKLITGDMDESDFSQQQSQLTSKKQSQIAGRNSESRDSSANKASDRNLNGSAHINSVLKAKIQEKYNKYEKQMGKQEGQNQANKSPEEQKFLAQYDFTF